MHAKKTAFVVEHDFIMATYLADRVVVYDGQPGVETTAHSPQALIPGMNTFLKQLNITFRRDPTNFRPRINKMDSIKDREQKAAGNYFYLEDSEQIINVLSPLFHFAEYSMETTVSISLRDFENVLSFPGHSVDINLDVMRSERALCNVGSRND